MAVRGQPRNLTIPVNLWDWSVHGSGPDCNGTVLSSGYNLVGDGSGCLGFTNSVKGDQIGASAAPIDPRLGPLADSGGPTLTHGLRANSPALDMGSSGGLATDQRGYPRAFDDPGVANALGGDGSDIGAYEVAVRITEVRNMGNDIRLRFTSALDQSYAVQSRTNLPTGTWTTLAGAISGNGGIAQTTVTNAFTQPTQFYRIQKLP
jgi:hypothetical protein